MQNLVEHRQECIMALYVIIGTLNQMLVSTEKTKPFYKVVLCVVLQEVEDVLSGEVHQLEKLRSILVQLLDMKIYQFVDY